MLFRSNVSNGMFQPARTFLKSYTQFATLPQLSPADVNQILRENEYSHHFTTADVAGVRGYDTNFLAANAPIEDTRTEGTFVHKNAFICGVFDGHGGPACSQVISKRLLRYIAASVLDRKTLLNELNKGCNSQSFLRCLNDKVEFVKEIRDIYEDSFQKYAHEISASKMDISRALENAFFRLDRDLSVEALTQQNARTFAVAMSGAVACVAFLENRNLYVANTGDSGAVLGSLNSDGKWIARRLSNEHNTDNITEISRVLKEHPKQERDTIFRQDRLLGQLLPTRAFGDFRYKWTAEVIQDFVVPHAGFGPSALPQYYLTPPYLTCQPEVTYHRLNPTDKFLILATDGLWEFLTPIQVVNIVGEHLANKKFLEPLRFAGQNMTLGEIAFQLAQRRANQRNRPLDQNSATHLIRVALGGTEYGIEHSKISHLLSLPKDVARMYRDDITITVIYFDSDKIGELS
ncbi:PDP1 family protein [Megaselia abdita]